MSAHSQITILQYNMHISKDKVMAPFFRDRTNDNYSVIAVQEPWINSHNPELITTHHSNTAHYELFFPTGANPHTCFFINKEIPVQNWTIVQHSPDLISLCLEHKELEETKHLWIHNIYCHESDNNHYNTSALWETALQAPGEHITVGDFNAHHPLWGGDIEPDSAGEQVLQTIDRFGLSSLLETGTITWEKGQSKTTIDLVLATPEAASRMITCQVHQQAHQDSDHLPIMTTLQLNIPKTQQVTRKNWALLNEKRFLEFLSQHLQQTPPELRNRQDVENILTHITEVLQQAIAETVPNINITKWSQPGFTQECKDHIQETKRLQWVWQRERTEEAWEEYKRARNNKGRFIKAQLRQIHQDSVEKASKDPSGLWKLAKWAKNRGNTRQGFTPAIQRPDGTIAQDPGEKAKLLADSFFPKPPEANLEDIQDFNYEAHHNRMRAYRNHNLNLPPDDKDPFCPQSPQGNSKRPY